MAFFDTPPVNTWTPAEWFNPLVRDSIGNIRIVCGMLAVPLNDSVHGYAESPLKVSLRFAQYETPPPDIENVSRGKLIENGEFGRQVRIKVQGIIGYGIPALAEIFGDPDAVSVYVKLADDRADVAKRLFPQIQELCAHYFGAALIGSERLNTTLQLKLDVQAFRTPAS